VVGISAECPEPASEQILHSSRGVRAERGAGLLLAASVLQLALGSETAQDRSCLTRTRTADLAMPCALSDCQNDSMPAPVSQFLQC